MYIYMHLNFPSVEGAGQIQPYSSSKKKVHVGDTFGAWDLAQISSRLTRRGKGAQEMTRVSSRYRDRVEVCRMGASLSNLQCWPDGRNKDQGHRLFGITSVLVMSPESLSPRQSANPTVCSSIKDVRLRWKLWMVGDSLWPLAVVSTK